MSANRSRAALIGATAALVLFAFYVVVLALVSGRDFVREQVATDWPFLLFLVPSFGLQVGLFTYLRGLVHGAKGTKAAVGTAGGVSGGAMIACCAHYLPTVLPFLGISAFATVVMTYRVPLLVFAVLSNLVGLGIVTRAIVKTKRVQHGEEACEMPSGQAAASSSSAGALVDPVCGMHIDEDAVAVRISHEGTSYPFCSASCADKFRAAPSRYAHKADASSTAPRSPTA